MENCDNDWKDLYIFAGNFFANNVKLRQEEVHLNLTFNMN